jgi:class 3 adenylate cyclase
MRICPTCGEENPDRARFCLTCGTRMAEEALAGQEIRKTITLLFSDLVGSTAMGERLDPESVRRVMTRYFEAMRAVIERHAGFLEKFIGDAVVARFGIPIVREDRPPGGPGRGGDERSP